MSDVLLPCPFCGGDAEHMSTDSYWVRCEDCCAEIQCQETKEDAVRMWNRRAHHATASEDEREYQRGAEVDFLSHVSQLRQAREWE